MKNKFYLIILLLVIVFAPLSYIKASSSSSIDSQIRYLKSEIAQVEANKKRAMDNLREYLGKIGALRTDGNSPTGLEELEKKYQNQIDSLEREIDDLKELKKTNQKEEDSINEALEDYSKAIEAIQTANTNMQYDSYCKETMGSVAFYDSSINKCRCSSGYFINKSGKCTTPQNLCVEQYGKNSIAKDGKCLTCKDGYKYDKSSGMCALVKKEMKTIPVIEKDTKKDLSYESFINEKSNIDSESVKKTNQSNNSITNKVVKFFKKILFWGSKN